MVVVDSLVDIAELARVVSDRAENSSLLRILDVGEELQSFCITSFLAEISSGKIKVVIAQGCGSSVDARICGAVPRLASFATGLHAATLATAVPGALGATLLAKGLCDRVAGVLNCPGV